MRNIIAILRGIVPKEIEATAEVLLDAGISKIEVTLNSPKALLSIQLLCSRFEGQGIFGAGTVLEVAQVSKLKQLGVQMIVSPNCNPMVIQATKNENLLSYPGVFTPSECFTALNLRADALKFYPGEIIKPQGLKAICAVLPKNTDCIAVGGVSADNVDDWLKAGATGLGVGSAIYNAGDGLNIIRKKATNIVRAYDDALR